jgi:hypothetical protein
MFNKYLVTGLVQLLTGYVRWSTIAMRLSALLLRCQLSLTSFAVLGYPVPRSTADRALVSESSRLGALLSKTEEKFSRGNRKKCLDLFFARWTQGRVNKLNGRAWCKANKKIG